MVRSTTPLRALASLASLVLAVACGAPTSGAHGPAAVAAGVFENTDGTWRIVGFSRTTPEAAMQDALTRAYSLAHQRGQKLTPLKIQPHGADAPGGGAEYSCALTFRMEPEQSALEAGAVDHEFASFEHRMRLLVEERVLTIEEYSRLIAAHPGNPLAVQRRAAAAPVR